MTHYLVLVSDICDCASFECPVAAGNVDDGPHHGRPILVVVEAPGAAAAATDLG